MKGIGFINKGGIMEVMIEEDRVKTGIYGLDPLLNGGFPRGRTILLAGACGTGKTVFAAQYIYKGAAEYNEPGIFVTMDELPSKFREDMLKFGWDYKAMEERGMIRLIDASLSKIGIPSDEEYSLPATGFDVDRLILEITRVAREIDAKRLVIDSIPAMGMRMESEEEVRKAILKLSYMLTRLGLTTILTTEVPEKGDSPDKVFSKYGVEEYVADGVILLSYFGGSMGATRTLYIRKMRGTDHSDEIHPIDIIGGKGFIVKKAEELAKELRQKSL